MTQLLSYNIKLFFSNHAIGCRTWYTKEIIEYWYSYSEHRISYSPYCPWKQIRCYTNSAYGTDRCFFVMQIHVCVPRLMWGSVRRTAEGYGSDTCNRLQAKWSIMWRNQPANQTQSLVRIRFRLHLLFHLFNPIKAIRTTETRYAHFEMFS